MEFQDDDLAYFAVHGTPPLSASARTALIEHDGASIWCAFIGTGPPVILLHGGLGHAGNWGRQVSDIVAAGYQAVLIDSRGHGRSTHDDSPYRYDRMASDVLAVMDALGIPKAALVGWSDGACTALIVADKGPERVCGVFFFACNMDPSGAKAFQPTATIERCFARHRQDYETLSQTPDQFDAFVVGVTQMMSTQPNYTAEDLARIRVPVVAVLGEQDEFIEPEHIDYIARTIPGARRLTLPGVSHFAPLQQPTVFNRAMLDFVRSVSNPTSDDT